MPGRRTLPATSTTSIPAADDPAELVGTAVGAAEGPAADAPLDARGTTALPVGPDALTGTSLGRPVSNHQPVAANTTMTVSPSAAIPRGAGSQRIRRPGRPGGACRPPIPAASAGTGSAPG